jgi:replicative DNA helicase
VVQSLEDARRRQRSEGGGSNRVPPHNLEAEESLLGAMLLSRDAIAAAVENCGVDDFYKPAYGHVFEAVLSLYERGEPADPVTVADELRRVDLLEAVGGAAVLVSLQANTPATSNAARYARIVEEHALLRRLIGVAGEIAEMGYSVPEDIEQVVDAAETLVFGVAQRRTVDTLRPIRDLLEDSLDRLEEMFGRGESITGVPTGYADLDERLAGLQPSNLVVVGARPGMGKTAFALGIVAHAAMEARTPVLFFSLEMSHPEISQRLLSAEARVDATRLRNGRLQESDWPKITHAIGRLAEAPIFVDDNPNISVMDIRAKARRMKSREGVGLIIVDYLQLMTGRSRAENRQVEISEISRGLKILARELSTPVLALSQLSRSLESRADKRPMLADLRESGCLPASTRILRADTGQEVTLGDLVLSQEQPLVWSVSDRKRLVPARLLRAFPSGRKPVFRVVLRSGRQIEATANHPFLTVEGWSRLDALGPGSFVATPRRIPSPIAAPDDWSDDEVTLLAHLLGDGTIGPSVKYATADAENKRVVEETARRLFGIGVTGKRLGRTWQLSLPSPYRLTHGRYHPVRGWLEPHGLWGSRAPDKFIPGAIFGLPEHKVVLFLHHLWATDGSVTVTRNARGPRVMTYYATTSHRLALDVQRLLLRLGIRARIGRSRKAGYRDGWHVRISGAAQQAQFLKMVGCHGARSDCIPEALTILEGIGENPNVDLVPWGVASRVKAAAAAAGVTHRHLADALGEAYGGSYLLGSATRPRRFSRGRLGRMADVLGSDELHDLATSDLFWDEIIEVVPAGVQPTFDATIEGSHNFIADGVVVHNSIEQDADVVLFIYRDELYNPDSADRGTAEIILSKHRNGPTGKTQLAFLDHYTRFANMARM